MGKRRLGFLTEWQEDYIRGHIEVSENRKRVEDHYILKSWRKAFEQFKLLESWLWERSRIDTTEAKALRMVFFSLKGKTPPKYYEFSRVLNCPYCLKDFNQYFFVQEGRVVIGKAETFGWEGKKREIRNKLSM